MEKKEHSSYSKPGLPEALHPEIGNGTSWENDPHNLTLRGPDPGKFLDDLLHDDSVKQGIIQNWLTPIIDSPGKDREDAEETTSSEKLVEKKKPIQKKASASSRKDPLPEWFEDAESKLVLKEDPNKSSGLIPHEETNADIFPEGKRVKKAAKKARKDLEKIKSKDKLIDPPKEQSLTPYTSWLKSLRGSEYVHPYEDDYGLEQLPVNQREGISETLAELLASQGYKERATAMYTQLMVKYPEKSSFFAAKIEALK